MREPSQLARFIHKEVPVRYAERIRDIEAIPDWEQNPDLQEMHDHHVEVFRRIRLLQRTDTERYMKIGSLSEPDIMNTFDDVVFHAQTIASEIPARATRAMRRLHAGASDQHSVEDLDQWLDDFLLNWIGSGALLGQYIACSQGLPNGIIEPECDVAEVCRSIASTIQDMCEDVYGIRPYIIVESFSAVEADKRAPRFSYIPVFLQYVLTEVLKNCCRATLDTCPKFKLSKRPTTVAVCADEHQVAIRISDRGRGIPFHVGDKIWSYMYSTGCKTKPTHAEYKDKEGPTPLVGFGCGLPLSRLYCRYLGGSMNVVSWPGYGTDVHLSLPRVSFQQIEVVPDLEVLEKSEERGQYITAKRFSH